MRLKAVTSILLIFILACGAPAMAFAYDPLTGAVAITSQGTIPFTPGPLLDDFTDGVGINAWGSLTGTFSKFDPAPSNSICVASYENNPAIAFGGTGHSLKLDYNVTYDKLGEKGFAGYYSKLDGGSVNSYTALSFQVKGASGGEYFKIELKTNSLDTNRNKAAVYITDFLDGGVTTNWRKVEIPFHNFANINNWSSMKEFVITFEGAQSGINGSPLSGAVYIDDISFVNRVFKAIRIDHYGDKVDACALGGNMGDMGGGGGAAQHTFLDALVPPPLYPNVLFSRYNVSSGWAGIFVKFGGGASGNTPMTHDFSAFGSLSFWIRAWQADRNPKGIKLELEDSGGKRTAWRGGITTVWQKMVIPFSDFSGLRINAIKQFNIIYDGRAIGGAGGDLNGGVFIDDLQFEE